LLYLDNIKWDKALQARMDANTLTIADHVLLSLANFTAALFSTMKTYIGSQVQSVTKPAVWVSFYSQKNSKKLIDTDEFTFGIEITYLPSTDTKNDMEINHAIFLLLQNLETLQSDIGTFSCYDKDSDITDGLGHVTGIVAVGEIALPTDPIINTAKELII